MTLAYHDEDVSDAPVVAEGLFLAFGEYGEVVIQAEDGRLQFCWPMLRVEPVADAERPHAAGCLGRHVGADDEWCYTSTRGDTSLRPPSEVAGSTLNETPASLQDDTAPASGLHGDVSGRHNATGDAR